MGSELQGIALIPRRELATSGCLNCRVASPRDSPLILRMSTFRFGPRLEEHRLRLESRWPHGPLSKALSGTGQSEVLLNEAPRKSRRLVLERTVHPL